MEEKRRRAVQVTTGVVAVVLLAALVGWWVLRDGDEPAPVVVRPTPVETRTDAPPTPTPTPTPRADPCDRQATTGFVPTTVSVEGVVRHAGVLALPRDSNNVPGTPPVNEKTVFAWDLDAAEPGSAQGQVLLNTHTWPDGSAMGNRLLAALQVGDGLQLGRPGQIACYRVTERKEVATGTLVDGYGAEDGPPQVVIVVCSGERLGPGDWTHRTLWFATPVR